MVNIIFLVCIKQSEQRVHSEWTQYKGLDWDDCGLTSVPIKYPVIHPNECFKHNITYNKSLQYIHGNEVVIEDMKVVNTRIKGGQIANCFEARGLRV